MTGYEVQCGYHAVYKTQMCKLWSQELYRMWSEVPPLSKTAQSTISNVYTGLQINVFRKWNHTVKIKKKKKMKEKKERKKARSETDSW